MSEGIENEKSEVKEKPVDTLAFKPKPEDVYKIDNRMIYYKGFLTLTEEEKAKVLLGFLTAGQEPEIDFLGDLSIEQKTTYTKSKYELWKDKQDFTNKNIVTFIAVGLIVITIIGLLSFLAYGAMKAGVTNDNTMFGEIFKNIIDLFKLLVNIFTKDLPDTP